MYVGRIDRIVDDYLAAGIDIGSVLVAEIMLAVLLGPSRFDIHFAFAVAIFNNLNLFSLAIGFFIGLVGVLQFTFFLVQVTSERAIRTFWIVLDELDEMWIPD